MKSKSLYIYLNTVFVGVISKSSSGEIIFKYTGEWIRDGFAISTSLPLQEDSFKGEVVSRYFDNLLPDNDEILSLLASKFGAESKRSFDLLSVIGRDCVGALSFLPKKMNTPLEFEMNYSKLSHAQIELKIKSLGSTSPLGMESAQDFRISIAGAQEKTAFLKIKNKWFEPHGLTPTTHILKNSIGALGMDINFEDSIDNEWASLFIMKKMGLSVCHAEITKFGDQRALVIERFDRKWINFRGKKTLLRVPQEDMCQALNVSPFRKYQADGGPGIVDIAKFLMRSKISEDRIKFFKAIVIFDLLHATDGHAKNFSIFLEEDGFRLTPFYDVMSGYFFHYREKKPLQQLKLAMKVGSSGHYHFKRISKRHYRETAKMCAINNEVFESIMADLKLRYENLQINETELDPLLNKTTLEIILKGMKKRAKVLFGND